MKCDSKECNSEATHRPKVCVPAMGYAIDGHQPLGAVFGLNLCLKHCKEFRVKETLALDIHGKPNLKRVFKMLAITNGKVEPDFDRAYVQPIPIDCEESQQFEKLK